MPDDLQELKASVRNIESRVIILERDQAVEGERHKSVIDHLDRIDNHVSETRSDQKWTFRLVVGAIIGAVATFIGKGGLNIVN